LCKPVFPKLVNKAEVVTLLCIKSQKSWKQEHSFENGNMIKECLVVLHDSLVSEFRNVIAMCIATKEAHLS
jgi:hypothetical protein